MKEVVASFSVESLSG